MKKQVKKIAFVVSEFPVVSQTWLLSQVTGLIDCGIEIDIYTMGKGSTDNIDEDYFAYKLHERTYNLDFPKNNIRRVAAAIPLLLKLLFMYPKTFVKVLNVHKYGKEALSLKLLFKVYPFVGKENKYDLIHCHFGTIANKFIPVKEILGLTQPHLCTFYGYDISHIPQEKGVDVYENVVRHFDQFLVMSENMKIRAVAVGIPSERTMVHSISINIENYPYHERVLENNEVIKLMSVGRFVEKKGYDDLIRALAIVKKETQVPFTFDLVGDGALRSELEELADSESVRDVLSFKGYMKLDDIQKLYKKTHLYVQPSKTAADGDME